jgi:hypothetical protein
LDKSRERPRTGGAPFSKVQDKGEENSVLALVQDNLLSLPGDLKKNAIVRQHLASAQERNGIQPDIMAVNADVLNSWKEVATYLGRGIRTVQRWERELGLPIRRPRGKSRSPIIAFRPELDRWLHNAPTAAIQQQEGSEKADRADESDLTNAA